MDALDKARQKLNAFLGGQKAPEPESAEDQTPDEKKLVAWVMEKVTEARTHSSRVAHEGVWLTNIAYLLGYDSVYYDTGTRAYKTLDGSQDVAKRAALSINKILPTIQNRLARLAKNPPKYDVRPESESNDDKEAARLGLKVLRNVWDTQKIDAKRLELYMWVQQCGHAYVGVVWDPDLGDLVPAPSAPAPMPGSTTEGGLLNETPTLDNPAGEEAEMVMEGDIRIDITSAFEGFADPMAKNFDEAAHFIKAKLRRLDYFKVHYGKRGELVKAEGNILQSLQYEQRINSLNAGGPMQSGSPQESAKNAATEIVYYEKRSKKYPRGRQIVVANGILLDDKELPVGEIPFAKFDDVLIAGKFFSESVITHMRPLQDCINTNKTKRSRWIDFLLAGKYIAARGHGIAQEALDDESGELLEYDPVPHAEAPHALDPPNIPNYAFADEESSEKAMYDIAGVNEISRGQLPAAGMPAVGMQFLQEQDDTRAGVVTEQHEHAWARVGMLILKYANKYYVTDRKLKEQNKDRSYRFTKFKGSDLRGCSDVIVIRGSTLPGSKVLRRQEIINGWQIGMLGEPNDPAVRQKVASMLEWGDVAEIWQDQALDMAQIEWKIMQVEAGQAPPVHELDNHVLTIQELNRYRKTEKYERLPVGQVDPNRVNLETGQAAYVPGPRDLFDALLEAHVQELTKLSNPQAVAMAEMPPEQMAAMAGAGAVPAAAAAGEAQGAEAEAAALAETGGLPQTESLPPA